MDQYGNPSWSGVHGVADASGNLAFDFYYMGLLPKENPNSPQDAILAFYGAAIFGRSLGGIAPSGWTCDHQLYGVQLDAGANPNPGIAMGSGNTLLDVRFAHRRLWPGAHGEPYSFRPNSYQHVRRGSFG
jgi:hypothetical protein